VGNQRSSVERARIHLEPRTMRELHGREVTTEEVYLVRVAVQLGAASPPLTRCHEVAVSRTEEGLHVVLHCEAPGAVTVDAVHAASQRIEDELHRRFPEIATVALHFEPA
jgi:divalent metal cation (Fe/Co/Zn/Cd) transporter